ncbi:MAG: lipopolysaccharide biosynthesis protein [Bryobacterales bacterium]|nr:lipopolysaccharide biosynthesis protein [Bryobacterales bacterium]
MTDYFGDLRATPGHGRRSLHGGVVSLAARGINAIIQVGSVVFLARLLAPEDYGIVAMVTSITGFATVLVDLGTRDAIVQRSSITEGEVSALFWITMLVGCLFALVVVICAPLFATFYGEPRLKMIASVCAITFVTASLSCQPYALLRRAMKFQQLCIIEVSSNLLGVTIAIAMAWYGFHYWALVVRPIVTTSLVAAGAWFQCRWLPGRPSVTPGVKEMLKFGVHLAGFTITDFGVGRSSDKVVIGYNSGAKKLGYYQNAMFIYDNLLDLIVSPLHSVGVASLSKVRHDLREFRRLWGKALSTLAFYSMPVFGLLAINSQDVVFVLLGNKWAPAGGVLSILALRGIPHCVERTLGWLHVSAGRSDRWMRYGIVSGAVQLSALFCGLPFGLYGVAVAYVICTFILFIPAIVYAGKPLGIGVRDVIAVVWRQLVGALVALACGYLLRHTLLFDTSRLYRMASLTLTYITTYVLVVVCLFRLRMPIGVVLHGIIDLLPTRLARLLRIPYCIDRYTYERI